MMLLYCTFTIGEKGYGAGVSAYQEIKELHANGTSLYVICLDPKGAPILEQLNVQYVIVDGTKLSVWSIIYFLFNLCSAYWPYRSADVLYINGKEFGLLPISRQHRKVVTYFRTSILGIKKALKKESIPVDIKRMLGHVVLLYLEKRLIVRSDVVLCKSLMMEEELRELYSVTKPIEVLPGGYSNEDIKADTYKSARGYEIAIVGRLVPVKGILFLLEVLSTMSSSPTLHIFGGYAGYTKAQQHAFKQQVESRVKELSLDVVFHGEKLSQELVQIYNNISLLCVPSLYEPYGLVALEGYLHGCKVLLSPYVGAAQDLAGKSGVGIYGKEYTANEVGILIAQLQYEDVHQESFDPDKTLTWEAIAEKILNILGNTK